VPEIWDGDYKLPWDEPGFSKRMLAEHLTQDHNMASRRVEWIDRQVEWIDQKLLAGRSATILDLGCGPGFYSHRLTARGHRCHGIDFAPAAIEYAQERNGDGARCEFVLGDIRKIAFGGPYDLAMILFGEMNVFSPSEVRAILQKAQASLVPRRGALILEIQTPEAIESSGHDEPFEEQCDSGLFSDRPYHYRTECRWLPEDRVTIQTFTITDAASGAAHVYRSATKAWSVEELRSLLEAAGFCRICQHADWPCNTDSLALWSAEICTMRTSGGRL
jgi:ubiquinone/menaquinone biosynthesis C-methylase UbiE